MDGRVRLSFRGRRRRRGGNERGRRDARARLDEVRGLERTHGEGHDDRAACAACEARWRVSLGALAQLSYWL